MKHIGSAWDYYNGVQQFEVQEGIATVICSECNEESWEEFSRERENGDRVCAECMSELDRAGYERAREIVYDRG